MNIPRDPDDDVLIVDWMTDVGDALEDRDRWRMAGVALSKKLVITNIGQLRDELDSDVSRALLYLGCERDTVKNKVAEFLMRAGRRPHQWAVPNDVRSRAAQSQALIQGRCNTKKLLSQKDRPTLGLELGQQTLKTLKLPDQTLRKIKHSPNLAMPSKGKCSTEQVANIIYEWAIAKWGNAHVDTLFCDKVGELLHERWPLLKPWGKPLIDAESGKEIVKQRCWSEIIKNRFGNVRSAKVRAFTTTTSMRIYFHALCLMRSVVCAMLAARSVREALHPDGGPLRFSKGAVEGWADGWHQRGQVDDGGIAAAVDGKEAGCRRASPAYA